MSDLLADMVGVEARLEQLCKPHQQLLDYAPTDATDEGVYIVVLRTWPHPDIDGVDIVAFDYAYLTHGSGSDGWTKDGNGMKQRVPEGVTVQQWLRGLGKMCLGASNRLKDADGDAEEVEPGFADIIGEEA